ncbi:hypothetical protein E2P30_02405 [Candidatus Bathyarchaeota archaeon]|nr:hypothetical protein E2P30_02405 [Candidatus Bathyarchaeota archaeon]
MQYIKESSHFEYLLKWENRLLESSFVLATKMAKFQVSQSTASLSRKLDKNAFTVETVPF